MGNWTKVLLLAACLVGASALRCNVGSAITGQDGAVLSQQGEQMECNGLCVSRSAPIGDEQTLNIFSCEDKHDVRDPDSEVCVEDGCNAVKGLMPFVDSSYAILAPNSRTCYVGIQHGAYLTGGEMACPEECANVTTTANGKPTTAYFCAPYALCAAIINSTSNVYEGCKTLDGGQLTGCCCSGGSNCNAPSQPFSTPAPYTKRPIACYEGIHVMGQLLSGGGYTACQGDCASLTYLYGGAIDVTLYTCDPASMCKGFNLANDCLNIDNGQFAGCCCDTDACIDPTVTPPRYPNGTHLDLLECFVGVHIAPNYTVGSEMMCDGQCGRIISNLNGYEIEAFFCAPTGLCRYLDAEGSCTDVPFGTVNVTGCCCTDSKNCNTHGTDIGPFPTNRPKRDTPIACYEGIGINGFPLNVGRYITCFGDCASLSVKSALAGNNYDMTLYTCDPASVCRGLGVVEDCKAIDGGIVSGCCCSTDACIDPHRNKYPNGTANDDLKCYVGVKIGHEIVIGGSMVCDGQCGSVNTRINGVDTTGFFCAPKDLCEGFGMTNDCTTLLLDEPVQGCCCTNRNDCNAEHHHVKPAPYTPPTAPPIACYAGLALNDYVFTDPDQYMTCRGDCASVTFASSYNGVPFTASLFTCDPVEVCRKLNMYNSCGSIGGNKLAGCCCNFDNCIDVQNRTIKPQPPAPYVPSKDLTCYVGLHIGKNFTVGNEMICDGHCGRMITNLNNVEVEAFFCAPKAICSVFNVDNTCGIIPTDNQNITACCCNDSNNCNTHGTDIDPVPTEKPKRDVPIVCYEGISINDLTVSGRFVTCRGDCASVSLASTLAGKPYTTTLYTCDPVAVCRGLGIVENCHSIDGTAVSGCCCSTDACIDPRHHKYPNGTANDALKCYVGVKIGQEINIGGSMVCDGMCGSVNSRINGVDTTGFFCAPKDLCEGFGMTNDCTSLLLDEPVQGCCCSERNDCNAEHHHVRPPPYTPPTAPPIACYAGLAINDYVFTDPDQYMTCRGDCASVTFASSYNGVAFTASLFTCDPVSVCNSLKMSNTCGAIGGNKLAGCCCNFNDCIDVQNRTIKPQPPAPYVPSKDITCYVGLHIGQNFTAGNEMICDGHCGRMITNLNNVEVEAFFCAPKALCSVFDVENACGVIPMDNQNITACCCNDSNNCNTHGTDIDPVPTDKPKRDVPIVCYEGISINDIKVSSRYVSCRGDCASVSLASTLAGKPYTTTLYTCDPVAVCRGLGIVENCHSINGTAVSGCCCSTDACIDPAHNKYPNGTAAADLKCFVGVKIGQNYTIGGSMECDGMCGSLNTRINGVDTTGFFCSPKDLCEGFGMTNDCTTMLLNEPVQGCCCNYKNDCNAAHHHVTPPPYTPPTAPPITCYAGLAINGLVLHGDKYMACKGDCAQATFQTAIAGTNIAATLFTCDPVSVCNSLGMNNTCGAVQGGVLHGCCCNFNDCIDTHTLTVKPQPTLPPRGDGKSASVLSIALSLFFVLIASLLRQ